MKELTVTMLSFVDAMKYAKYGLLASALADYCWLIVFLFKTLNILLRFHITSNLSMYTIAERG